MDRELQTKAQLKKPEPTIHASRVWNIILSHTSKNIDVLAFDKTFTRFQHLINLLIEHPEVSHQFNREEPKWIQPYFLCACFRCNNFKYKYCLFLFVCQREQLDISKITSLPLFREFLFC